MHTFTQTQEHNKTMGVVSSPQPLPVHSKNPTTKQQPSKGIKPTNATDNEEQQKENVSYNKGNNKGNNGGKVGRPLPFGEKKQNEPPVSKKAKLGETLAPKNKGNNNNNKKGNHSSTTSNTSKSDYSAKPFYLKVMSMKVTELRGELRSRGCDVGGLKKVLQQRLLKVMSEEQDQDKMDKPSTTEEGTNQSKPGRFKALSAGNDDDAGSEEEDVAIDEKENDSAMDTGEEGGTAGDDTGDTDGRMSIENVSKVVIPVATAATSKPKARQPVKPNKNEKAKKKSPIKTKAGGKSNFVKATAKLFSPNALTSKFQQKRDGTDHCDEQDEHDDDASAAAMQKAGCGSGMAMSPLAQVRSAVVSTATSFLSSAKKRKIKQDGDGATKQKKEEENNNKKKTDDETDKGLKESSSTTQE